MLWCSSVLLAFGFGAGTAWHLARAGEPQTAQAIPVKPPVIPAISEKPRLDAAEGTADESEKQDDSGENDRLRVAFRQALKEVVSRQRKQPGSPAPPHIQALWDRAFARWRQQKESGVFGGLDENRSLMADMSRMGAPGMKFLAALTEDGQRSMEERELTLSVLACNSR